MALNIFEPRYRLMVRRCMEGNRSFGMATVNRQHQLSEVRLPRALKVVCWLGGWPAGCKGCARATQGVKCGLLAARDALGLSGACSCCGGCAPAVKGVLLLCKLRCGCEGGAGSGRPAFWVR